MSMRKRLCSKLFLTDQRKTKENTCARSFSTRVKGLGGKSSPSGPRLRSLLENDNWERFGWNFWRLSYNFIKLCCFKLFRNLFRRRWPRFKDGVPPGDGVANGDSGGMNNRNVSASKNCMIPWNIKFSFSLSRTFPPIYWELKLKNILPLLFTSLILICDFCVDEKIKFRCINVFHVWYFNQKRKQKWQG